jgi:hypothetical protein
VSEEDLATVRAEFPGYKIWREVFPGRDRYVVRSLLPGLSPHTVVTDDLSELRGLLEPAGPSPAGGFTTARANVARMYAHWLGGKDCFEADRAAADGILAAFPEIAGVARANRGFVARAVRHVARQGVRQFVDFGAGLPDSPNVHEVAREQVPDARWSTSIMIRWCCRTLGRCWPPTRTSAWWPGICGVRRWRWPIPRWAR